MAPTTNENSSPSPSHLPENDNDISVPTIDLSLPDDVIIPEIAAACSKYGFFLVIHHDIDLLDTFRSEMQSYFHTLSSSTKRSMKRHQSNARGYFDDELTKQKRDWKECLDVGVPGSRNWNIDDSHPSNTCLDGINQFPTCYNNGNDAQEQQLPHFRPTVVEYFEACATLSKRLALLMAKGLGVFDDDHDITTNKTKEFLQELAENHTSYLRMNHYPPRRKEHLEIDGDPNVLGISPHRDAGFLTVLLQDDDCHSLQVWIPPEQQWITVHPVPNSLTINTGDMCMIWSNGRYQAPLHRVLTNSALERYSAPFFYNPGYNSMIEPIVLPSSAHQKKLTDEETVDGSNSNATIACQCQQQTQYHPCLWGYFRAVRFAGDLTNLGVEIQVEDYQIEGGNAKQMEKQRLFAEQAEFSEAFSVEKYRSLLQG